MYAFERREKILEILRTSGRISIAEDARLLGISTSTLHRDLEQLAQAGVVRRVRGGAVPSDISQIETHFDVRMKTMVDKKQEIARVAVGTINDDSSIFLDHSSTTVYLAREIRRRRFRNLIVVTNSLVVPNELCEKRGVQVMLTGGVVECQFKALSGRWVIDAVQRLNLHQLFVSVGAISLELGLMTQIPFIHELLPELFACGAEINVLVDSSKFFKKATFQLAQLDSSLRIFTDAAIPEQIRADLESRGLKIIVSIPHP